MIVADPHRFEELVTAARTLCPVMPRARAGAEATSDIQGTRAGLLDKGWTCTPRAAEAIGAALSRCEIQTSGGVVKLVKAGDPEVCRDDSAAALVLAGGWWGRRAPRQDSGVFRVADGTVSWYPPLSQPA